MTKYKFYLPNWVYSSIPPKGFCSSDWLHYLICAPVRLHGLQGNRFNFSVTVLPNRMQDLRYHSYSMLSANMYINVDILLITSPSLPLTHLCFPSSCSECVECPWNEDRSSPEFSGLVPLPGEEEAWGCVNRWNHPRFGTLSTGPFLPTS